MRYLYLTIMLFINATEVFNLHLGTNFSLARYIASLLAALMVLLEGVLTIRDTNKKLRDCDMDELYNFTKGACIASYELLMAQKEFCRFPLFRTYSDFKKHVRRFYNRRYKELRRSGELKSDVTFC
jgi:hypothetical protein